MQQRLFVQIEPATFRLSNDPDANQVREGVFLVSKQNTIKTRVLSQAESFHEQIGNNARDARRIAWQWISEQPNFRVYHHVVQSRLNAKRLKQGADRPLSFRVMFVHEKYQ